MEWTAEEEEQLLLAMDGLKPVGINKHFNMLSIADRLSKKLNREIPVDEIWAHLRTLYNLDVLDEIEPLPFPNDQTEFSLPDEFTPFLTKKRAASAGDEENRASAELNNSAMDAMNVTPVRGLANAAGRDGGDKKANAKSDTIPKRAVTRTRGTLSGDFKASPPASVTKRRRI